MADNNIRPFCWCRLECLNQCNWKEDLRRFSSDCVSMMNVILLTVDIFRISVIKQFEWSVCVRRRAKYMYIESFGEIKWNKILAINARVMSSRPFCGLFRTIRNEQCVRFVGDNDSTEERWKHLRQREPQFVAMNSTMIYVEMWYNNLLTHEISFL